MKQSAQEGTGCSVDKVPDFMEPEISIQHSQLHTLYHTHQVHATPFHAFTTAHTLYHIHPVHAVPFHLRPISILSHSFQAVSCPHFPHQTLHAPLLPPQVPNSSHLLIKLYKILQYSHYSIFNTLRTGDADLRFYITTVQDGWRKYAFLTCASFPCTIHLIVKYIEPVSERSCWRMFIETWPRSELTFRQRVSCI